AAPARAPPSFPTRRSSDLVTIGRFFAPSASAGVAYLSATIRSSEWLRRPTAAAMFTYGLWHWLPWMMPASIAASSRFTSDACLRSEEHTSELQSPYDLVCR